ncbi:MAG TPA: hypothetical protein VIT44_13580, partial [Cyclobacteriaceae bacterium]
MKRIYCLILITTVLLACNSENDAVSTSNSEKKILPRTHSTLTSNYEAFGVLYPIGTIITAVNSTTVEITLPDGYYFVIQKPNGDILFKNKQCHECTCTAGGSSGCDPTYGEGGFGCDHSSPCTTCQSKTVDCDSPLLADTNYIAIIDSTEDFRFINSVEDFENLSDFQIRTSTNATLLFDTLNFSNLKSTL